MSKIKLKIVGLSYHQMHKDGYVLVLSEEQGNRRLPIVIGGFEAQAIAKEVEKVKTERPLTHDTFCAFAFSFGIRIIEVIIHKFDSGIFYANLLCSDGKREILLDSRTSDAVALALRFNAQIYTNEEVLQDAGVILEEDDKEDVIENDDVESTENPENEPSTSFEKYSIEEMQEMMDRAIENEEYERASTLRDEITKRTTKT